jgi:phosphatidylglycerophosphate synthase
MIEPPETRLHAWTEMHALAMLAGGIAVAGGLPGASCYVPAAVSFILLAYVFRHAWSPGGHFGAANAITALRFLLTGALLLDDAIPADWQAVAAALILLLDGFDGWLARRLGLVSRFGATFDMEVDAFFTLALCVALYGSGRFGFWILLSGALRYLFVLFIRLARPPLQRERSNRWSRAVGAIVLSGLTLSLLPIGTWAAAIAAAVTIAVVGSFAASIWQLYHP